MTIETAKVLVSIAMACIIFLVFVTLIVYGESTFAYVIRILLTIAMMWVLLVKF